jgi:hypothetical protein
MVDQELWDTLRPQVEVTAAAVFAVVSTLIWQRRRRIGLWWFAFFDDVSRHRTGRVSRGAVVSAVRRIREERGTLGADTRQMKRYINPEERARMKARISGKIAPRRPACEPVTARSVLELKQKEKR